jgi:hypothetical protein
VSFSSGAAWADLDNDGDLDWVVNNINDEAFLYKNNFSENNYLQVNLAGDSLNRNGLGSTIELHYNQGKRQVYETSPYRGYLSSVQNMPHFGLGKTDIVDSLIITWPNGKRQLIKQVKTNQVITVNITDAVLTGTSGAVLLAENSLFKEITSSVKINYMHHDSDFVDFNIQRLLPHKFSEYGPALAVADINGDGLDDMVSGGSYYYNAQFFLQQPNGSFAQKELLNNTSFDKKKNVEDMGILLFDADNDSDQDLYIASGGYEAKSGSASYRDRFYLNDGKARLNGEVGQGNFTIDTTAFPVNLTSKSCVRAADFDKDGDLDVLIAGRVEPGNYPKAVSSILYRNDTKGGNIKFTDVTGVIAESLLNTGMVCDALFTDFDNDSWTDIILVAEWQSVKFLKNTQGKFEDKTAASGLQNQTGWWNSIAPGDFDNDGDMDYIAGNLGTNSFYKASEKYPSSITADDFDKNGSYDALISVYVPESAEKRKLKEYTVPLRDDYISQLPQARKHFLNYKSYADATLNELIAGFNNKNVLRMQAVNFKSSLLRNEGNGKFTLLPLPVQAQFSMINGMVIEDFDGDGNLDVVINGNDYGTEVFTGRYDALNGLFLKGDGKGNFTALTILQSGIYIPGNGKALAMLESADNKCLLAASQNKGQLKILQLKKENSCIRFQSADISALIKYKNGTVQKREKNYGASFLSQSAQLIIITSHMASAEITDNKGVKRIVNF